MKLDVSSLERAVSQLEISLKHCHGDLARADSEVFIQFRAAAIKAFEYVYELGVKMLRRQLAEIETPADVERLSYRDLLRLSAEKEFIQDPQAWFQFRENRSMTSHTYDEAKAELIYETLPGFLTHAKQLLKQLQNYNA